MRICIEDGLTRVQDDICKDLTADVERLTAALRLYVCPGQATCPTPRTLNGLCIYSLMRRFGRQCGEPARAALKKE